MPIRTVAILSPGNMGHSVGQVLRHGGLRVITCLEGRSERTRALAKKSGIEAVSDLDAIVREADLVLSIVAPSIAGDLVDNLAAALQRTGAHPLVADCNAISPQTARELYKVIAAAGGTFVDASIVGPPPRSGDGNTRFYASGAYAAELTSLNKSGLDIHVIGDAIGLASGLKMCYAALTKGLTALGCEAHVAAETMGLAVWLRRELQMSQPALLTWLEDFVPGMPPKAQRWVGEMEQIATTFSAVGLTPRMMLGAADFYRAVEINRLSDEHSLEQIARALATRV